MFDMFRRRWALFNSAGFILGFVSFGLVSAIAAYFRPDALSQLDGFQFYQSLDPNALPEGLDRGTYELMYRYMLIQHLVMYPVFGAILGSLQAVQVHKYVPGFYRWIGLSALGFLSVISLELIKRHLAIGPFAGPVEPILIVLGGGGMAGLFQYFYLRTRERHSVKWFLLWVGGLVIGIVVAVAILMGIGRILTTPIQALEASSPKLSLGIELSIFGGFAGAIAGLISGGALRDSLQISAD